MGKGTTYRYFAFFAGSGAFLLASTCLSVPRSSYQKLQRGVLPKTYSSTQAQSVAEVSKDSSFRRAEPNTSWTLGTSATHFVGSAATRGDSQPLYFSLEGALKTDTKILGQSLKLDAFGLMSLNQTKFRFYEVKEGTLSFGNLHVGRRPVTWIALDEVWGLGLYSSRFRWDYLAPETIPLTGITWSQNLGSRGQFHFFTSYLFIPERGAPIDFAEGRIQSQSEWVISPPDSTAIRGVATPVRYSLSTPQISKIVLNPSVSASYALDRGTGPVARVSAAYKPINQLFLGYEATLSGGLSQVDVTLFPRVLYHTLVGVEAGYQSRHFQGLLSSLYDRPENEREVTPDTTVRNFTYQRAGTYAVLSPNMKVALTQAGIAEGPILEAAYLERFGTTPLDAGFYADGTTHFEARLPFRRMALVGIDSGRAFQSFRGVVRVRGDLVNPGTILSWRVERNILSRGQVFVSADFLTRFNGGDLGGSDDFIGRYRSNDRFQGGVRFAF